MKLQRLRPTLTRLPDLACRSNWIQCEHSELGEIRYHYPGLPRTRGFYKPEIRSSRKFCGDVAYLVTPARLEAPIKWSPPRCCKSRAKRSLQAVCPSNEGESEKNQQNQHRSGAGDAWNVRTEPQATASWLRRDTLPGNVCLYGMSVLTFAKNANVPPDARIGLLQHLSYTPTSHRYIYFL